MDLVKLIRVVFMIAIGSVVGALIGFVLSFFVVFAIVMLGSSYQILAPILAFDPFAAGFYTIFWCTIAGALVGLVFG